MRKFDNCLFTGPPLEMSTVPEIGQKSEMDDYEIPEERKTMFQTALEMTTRILEVEIPESWMCTRMQNVRGSDTSLPDGMEHGPTSTPGNEIGFNVPQSTKSAWAWHATGNIGDGTWKKLFKADDPRNPKKIINLEEKNEICNT